MKRNKQLRLLVVGLVLALTLTVARPAVAEPLSWSGGWVTSGFEQLGRWWSSVWGTPLEAVRAGSEVTPNLDPDGVTPLPEEPDDDSLLTVNDEPGGESEVTPRLDPDG